MQTGSAPSSQSRTDRIQQAIQALRAGDTATTRRLLAEELRNNPASENAWLVMAAVVETPEQRQECLERVLAINPNSTRALQALQELEPWAAKKSAETSPSLQDTSENSITEPFSNNEENTWAPATFEVPAEETRWTPASLSDSDVEGQIDPFTLAPDETMDGRPGQLETFADRLGSVLREHQESEELPQGAESTSETGETVNNPSNPPLFNPFAFASAGIHWEKEEQDAPSEGQVNWDASFSEEESDESVITDLPTVSLIQQPAADEGEETEDTGELSFAPFPPAPISTGDGMVFEEQPATLRPKGGVVKIVLVSLALLVTVSAFFGGLLWTYITWTDLNRQFPANPLMAFGMPGGLALGGLIVSILLVFGLMRVLNSMQDSIELEREGNVINGEVHRRWTEATSANTDLPIYWVLYRFVLHPRTGGEEIFQVRQVVDETSFNDLTEGSEVAVRYLSRDPRISRLESHSELPR